MKMGKFKTSKAKQGKKPKHEDGYSDDAANWVSRDDLPEDAVNWKNVKLRFRELQDGTINSCPTSVDELFEYVQMESADVDKAERTRLRFLRTAQVFEMEYWIWEYIDSYIDRCLVTVRYDPDEGSVEHALASDNGLSVEQYILADYFDEVYWS